MRSGRLRHRITIKRPIQTPDGMGGITTTWGTVCVCWAAIEPLRGKEFYDSQMENSEVTGKIVMRYLARINSTMKVFFGEREFEIIAPINVEEKNRELQLMVKELVIV